MKCVKTSQKRRWKMKKKQQHAAEQTSSPGMFPRRAARTRVPGELRWVTFLTVTRWKAMLVFLWSNGCWPLLEQHASSNGALKVKSCFCIKPVASWSLMDTFTCFGGGTEPHLSTYTARWPLHFQTSPHFLSSNPNSILIHQNWFLSAIITVSPDTVNLNNCMVSFFFFNWTHLIYFSMFYCVFFQFLTRMVSLGVQKGTYA